MPTEGRVYAGLSDDQRRAERRDRLIAAGLELFGTQGAAATSIEQLCQVGKVATRSFYEEFGTREALLKAVYNQLLDEAGRTTVAAVRRSTGDLEERTRAGLEAYVGYLTADRRRARVIGLEGRSTPALQIERSRALERFGTLARDRSLLPDTPGSRVLALALAGAVSEVVADWATADGAGPDARGEDQVAADVEIIVDVLSTTFVAALTAARLVAVE